MQHFPALPNPLAWLLGQYATAMNHQLQQYLAQNSRFKFLHFDMHAFQTMNLPMASDGFHPSKEIYQIWGKEVSDRILEWF